MTLTNNIKDVALIFEGGGMRASYTSAVVATLLENELYFDYVAGISAGSSNVVNYVARQKERARACFVDFAADPQFGDLRTFLRGQGLFNSEYIYEQTSGPDGPLPLEFSQFTDNPAQFRIGSFNCETGNTHYWSNKDVTTHERLMKAVRASSSMPIVMPPVDIDGQLHLDGAIGSSGGIPLDVAKADGYEKFFFVLTRPRDYVKKPPRNPRFYRRALRNLPLAAEATINRWKRYNDTREEILELEREGKAYVFWAENMMVSNQERNVAKLARNYNRGRLQAVRELPQWRDFLGV